MPQFGTIKRVKPRVRVLRGYNPQEPHTLSQAAPASLKDAAAGAVNPLVGIKSGQVISLNYVNSEYVWELGCAAGRTPYIALNDAFDEDVIEAGNMPGLSCAGQFEIQTPYFKSADADNFVVDAPVTYDGVTGNIKVAGATDPVIGFVTRNHGKVSLGQSANGNDGTNSSATDLDVVVFTTSFAPGNLLPA